MLIELYCHTNSKIEIKNTKDDESNAEDNFMVILIISIVIPIVVIIAIIIIIVVCTRRERKNREFYAYNIRRYIYANQISRYLTTINHQNQNQYPDVQTNQNIISNNNNTNSLRDISPTLNNNDNVNVNNEDIQKPDNNIIPKDKELIHLNQNNLEPSKEIVGQKVRTIKNKS